MKTRELYKKHPLITMVCTFALIDVCSMVFDGRDLPTQVMSTSLAAVVTAELVYILIPSVLAVRFSGRKKDSSERELANIAWWVVLAGLLSSALTLVCASIGVGSIPGVEGVERTTGLLQLESALESSSSITLAQRALLAFLLCAVTAIFEEGFFRGIVVPCAYERSWREIEGARETRNSSTAETAERSLPFEKNPALSAALFSGILFGLIRIAGFGVGGEGIPAASGALATGGVVLQALLKALQAGMFGFCMAALLLKTRSLALPVLVHALFNLLYFAPSYLATGAVSSTYVTGNNGDIAALILSIALLLAPCAKSMRLITHEVVPYCSFDE